MPKTRRKCQTLAKFNKFNRKKLRRETRVNAQEVEQASNAEAHGLASRIQF